jgi:hypothetical protein
MAVGPGSANANDFTGPKHPPVIKNPRPGTIYLVDCSSVFLGLRPQRSAIWDQSSSTSGPWLSGAKVGAQLESSAAFSESIPKA